MIKTIIRIVDFFHEFYKKDNRGFTLIELLVVIAIIGVLTAIAAPIVVSRIEIARETADSSNVRVINNALDLYYLQNGSYPGQGADLGAELTDYLIKFPKDPWDKGRSYNNTYNHEEGRVYPLGPPAPEEPAPAPEEPAPAPEEPAPPAEEPAPAPAPVEPVLPAPPPEIPPPPGQGYI